MLQGRNIIKKVEYCNGWQNSGGKPFVIFTEDQARDIHESIGNYGVMFYTNDGEIPSIVVELQGSIQTNRILNVKFLGENGEMKFIYYYKMIKESKDFYLFSAMHFYGERSGESLMDHTIRMRHTFDYDGTATSTVFIDRKKPEKLFWNCDVSKHYKKHPEFNQYEDFLDLDFGQDWNISAETLADVQRPPV